MRHKLSNGGKGSATRHTSDNEKYGEGHEKALPNAFVPAWKRRLEEKRRQEEEERLNKESENECEDEELQCED